VIRQQFTRVAGNIRAVTRLESGIRTCIGGAVVAFALARSASAQATACASSDSTPASAARWRAPLDRPVVARPAVIALREALDRVAAITKIRLSYSAEALPLDRAVCFAANGQPIGRVLADLLAGTNVAAVSVGADQIVLAPRAPPTNEAPPQVAQTTTVLDRVVVTGSTMGAPERELTVGLNVLSGRQLARDQSSTLSSALDGYVPGVWSWPQSPSSVITSYASIRGASSFGLSYPKIYIDGIEVANPLLVTRFAADAIDRIEVIRGPQGSALYGTDAISGVINIVTRHEGAPADGEPASLRTTAGVVQSDFARSSLAQTHALSIFTGSSTRSADLHVSAGTVGDFIPDGYSRDLIATGSARVVGSRSTLSATGRYFMQDAGSAVSPLLARPSPTDTELQQAQDTLPQRIRQYTLGATATYAPDERWTHSTTVGFDGYRLANVRANATPFPSVALQDSALLAAQGSAIRGTLRGTSVLRLGDSDAARGTLTFTAEHGVFRSSTPTMMNQPGPNPPTGPGASTGGNPPSTAVGSSRTVTWHNSTGFTTQANASFDNLVYITGGVRLERDNRLPGSQLATLPMIGAAAVREYGPLTVKLRTAYGQGIRPASTFGHAEFWQGAYGWLAQQNLGAEKQAGTEAGLDLMLRRAFTFRVTRFDQRASGLIQLVAVAADSDPRSRRVRYDLENVGEISNTGWELESSASISQLSLSGTLSFVRSQVERVAVGYKGDLIAGDRMLQVPARTGSFAVSWLAKDWFASLGASRAFDWINYDELGLANAFLSGDRSAHEIVGQQLRQYWRRYNGSLRVRATASRDIRGLFSFEVSGDNLLDYQRNEPDNLTVVPGRTLMTGVKVRF
jgi:hypothetical protein